MRPYRTVLEQKIRERRMTLEEFAAYAETFAREHGEPGTLSLRHLQRLVSGKGAKGQPLGAIRPATARLLERIFELSTNELLSAPSSSHPSAGDEAAELQQRIRTSRRVDSGVLHALRGQLATIRRLDREFGAVATHEEVCAKISQVQELFKHSLPGENRKALAIVLSELHALAGWQALDLGFHAESWKHYEQAKSAALESEENAYHAHAVAEQCFTLIDLGDTVAAAELLEPSRRDAKKRFPAILRAWLSAAHGEVLAANGQRNESLKLFDEADSLLTGSRSNPDGPYIVLDRNHLSRWRGHALSGFAPPDAIKHLTEALDSLDSTFTRAETGLQVDLGAAFLVTGNSDLAEEHIGRAEWLACSIGSARQLRRIRSLKLDRRR